MTVLFICPASLWQRGYMDILTAAGDAPIVIGVDLADDCVEHEVILAAPKVQIAQLLPLVRENVMRTHPTTARELRRAERQRRR